MALNKQQQIALTAQMEKDKYYNTTERERAHVDEKHRYGRLNRYMNIQRKELEAERQDMKERETAALNEKRFEDENKFCLEFDKLKEEEMRKVLLRQQLRQNCYELRELEAQLRCAYVNKELTAQIAENEAARLNQKIQDRLDSERLNQAIIQEQEFMKTQKEEEFKRKAQYKQELQDQMIYKDKYRRYLYEEFLREKKLIDDVIQRIHDEDQREIEEKLCKMKRTREEIDKFKEAQMLFRKRKRDELEAENIKLQEYLSTKTSDANARLEEQRRKEALKEEISEKIAKDLYAQMMKKKEREDIIQELLEEESKERDEKRHRDEIEKEIRQRAEIRQSLAIQVEERAERARREADEDAQYKAQLLAKIAEDEKLEQLTAQKRRLKMMQIRKDVEDMMVERRQRRAEDLRMYLKLQKQEQAELKERQKIIEEERIRMLQEHAGNLIGFLPKGMLKPEDLPHLPHGILK